MVKHFNLFTRASLLLALVFLSTSYSQNNLPNFKNYYKLGLLVGIDRLPVSNEKNGVGFNLKTVKAINIGIEYNFYSLKNFNFKTGFISRSYFRKYTQNFKKEDSGLPYNLAGELSTGRYEQYKVPIMIEYSFYKKGSVNAFIGFGPEVIYDIQTYGSGSFLQTNLDGTQSGYIEKDIVKKNNFSVGLNTNIGINIATKYLLLKPYINYHFQPKDLYTQELTTQNLPVSQNGTSYHKIKGNYLMFGVSMFPGKAIFKKKQKP